MPKAIQSYDDFWPFYLGEHARPLTRTLHIVGTSLALVLLAVALATQTWWLLAVALVCGYAFAWVSHMAVEKNRPATFSYPLWSFVSDFRMLGYFYAGKLDEEVRRCSNRR